jgi:peptidoglycan/LPS O-acetylase OafA/YrhL
MARRIPSLDGLRAVSITLVLVSHLIGTRGVPHFFNVPEDLGNLGVRTFFVISGFLITGLLLDEKATTGMISLKKFYLRRIFRIFPASYAYIGVMGLLSVFGVIALKHNDLLCAVTYTVNNHYVHSWWIGHLWSLSVEEQFYLLWPATMVFLGTRRAYWAACGAFLAAPLFRILILIFLPAHRPGVGAVFPTVADAMAIGCILACVRDRLGEDPRYVNFLRSRWFVLVPIGVFVLNYPLSTKVSALVGVSLLNVAIALCLDWCVRTPESLVGRILNTRGFAWIGALSYSLYLWQQPFINRNSDHWVNSAPINLVFAFCAAVVSYYLIEKPFLKLKTRFETVPHRDEEQKVMTTKEVPGLQRTQDIVSS